MSIIRVGVLLILLGQGFAAFAEHDRAMPGDKRASDKNATGVAGMASISIFFEGGTAFIKNIRKDGNGIIADVEVGYPFLRKYKDVKFSPDVFVGTNALNADVGGIRIQLNQPLGYVKKPRIWGGLLLGAELKVVTWNPTFK